MVRAQLQRLGAVCEALEAGFGLEMQTNANSVGPLWSQTEARPGQIQHGSRQPNLKSIKRYADAGRGGAKRLNAQGTRKGSTAGGRGI